MKYYDFFNGDADGIISLHQYRLQFPQKSEVFTKNMPLGEWMVVVRENYFFGELLTVPTFLNSCIFLLFWNRLVTNPQLKPSVIT